MADLDNALENYKVVVVSKSYCPYCTKAKNTLAGYGIKSYKVIECDSKPEVQARAQELTGQRTVPNVFINGVSIGGNDNTQALHNSGKLKQMLEEAQAL